MGRVMVGFGGWMSGNGSPHHQPRPRPPRPRPPRTTTRTRRPPCRRMGRHAAGAVQHHAHTGQLIDLPDWRQDAREREIGPYQAPERNRERDPVAGPTSAGKRTGRGSLSEGIVLRQNLECPTSDADSGARDPFPNGVFRNAVCGCELTNASSFPEVVHKERPIFDGCVFDRTDHRVGCRICGMVAVESRDEILATDT